MAAAASALAAVLLCAAAFSAKTMTAAAADGDLVAKTCADVMNHNWAPQLDAKFCESRLRLDKKRSAAAKHPRDLALVAMDLAQRAVADADAKVAGVLRSGAGHRSNDTATRIILRNCRLDYAAVVSTIPVCRAMAVDYKPGAGRDQQQLAPNDHFECASRLRSETWSCWSSVVLEDYMSKLVLKEVKEAWRRVELVGAMLEEMLGIVIEDH